MITSVLDNWIILTAGLGAPNFRDAGDRIRKQALRMGIAAKVIVVFEEDLEQICPQTNKKYQSYFNGTHHGFGYFAWKAEIVNAAFLGKWGEISGVIWVDSGCEINPNPISRRRLQKFMRHAINHGAASFTLNTTDEQYTKSKLAKLSNFQGVNIEAPQFQATWFLLAGETGREISAEWLRISLLDISYLDFSSGEESANFVEHRFDQSIFSLVLKSKHIVPLPNYVAVDGHSIKSQIRGFSHPFWTSRNRTGASINRWMLFRQ